MTIKIEMTAAPDLGVLADIHGACFEKGWDAAAIGEMLDIAGTAAFVAGDGSGFGLLRLLGEEAEILTLAVLPRARRSGIGHALVSAMIDFAGLQKAKALFLEVGEANQAACGLYEKCGFSIVSRRRDYYRKADGSHEDALVMRHLSGIAG